MNHDLHIEGESLGDHCLHQLVEKHHVKHRAAHNSWGENLPSVVEIGDFLPSVTIHGGYVLLPEKIEYKYVQILTSVGGKYNLPTVLVRVVYVQLPATIVGRYILPSVLAGYSVLYL